MHDTQVEDRLRRLLRHEGDEMPFTVTTAELERRLAARRRASGGRRLSLVAAVVAAIAVGSLVAAGNGWLKLPAMGTAPSPSPSASPGAEHSAVPPVASPTGAPAAARPPLGTPDQAIMVRPIGASWTTPDSLEVTRYDPKDGSSEVIATIPGSVVPAGKWLSTATKPTVSLTGWLAIPVTPGPDATDKDPAIVMVDLLDPTAAPQTIVGLSSGSWSGDDTFAAIGQDGGIQLYYPATRELFSSPIKDPAVSVATVKDAETEPVWTTTPNTRFVGKRDTGATTPSGSSVWGAISVDGSFAATTDLPPTYQRTGLERPAGADAHGFQMACTGSGSALEAGCTMIETDATGTTIATRVGTPDYAYLADVAWAAEGRDAWLLFRPGPEVGAVGGGMASLARSGPTGSRQELAQIGDPTGADLRILGIGAATADGAATVVVGDAERFFRVFALSGGGTASPYEARSVWFAGWAGPQPDYDPD